jgi:DNA-directed RNA polymerase sigma subunit (sigma70/sigma32)
MHSSGRNNQWFHSNNASSALTLQEIADAMSLTRERVRQIEAKALTKLRKKMQAKGIKASDLIDL